MPLDKKRLVAIVLRTPGPIRIPW